MSRNGMILGLLLVLTVIGMALAPLPTLAPAQALPNEIVDPAPFAWTFKTSPEPHYVDVAEAVNACEADLAASGRFGVTSLRYWVSEHAGKVFRLVEAEESGLARPLRSKAHPYAAYEIYPVAERVQHQAGASGLDLEDTSTEGG